MEMLCQQVFERSLLQSRTSKKRMGMIITLEKNFQNENRVGNNYLSVILKIIFILEGWVVLLSRK